MKGWTAGLALASVCALVGCTGDDASWGGRGACAYGGALTDCPDAERTAEAACWRLVDCGAIPVSHEDDGFFDWGSCVDRINSRIVERRRLITSCIATSVCDELRMQGSPTPRNHQARAMRCFAYEGP